MALRTKTVSTRKGIAGKGAGAPASGSRPAKPMRPLPGPDFGDTQALAQLPVPFCCVTETGEVERRNESFDAMLGSSFQKPIDIFKHLEKDDQEKLRQAFEFVIKWGQPFTLRLTFGARKGLKRSADARLQLVVKQKERLFCCVFWPVDELSAGESQKSLLMSLEKALAQKSLELAEQKSYFETFCYTASHDLRAPLRSIKGFTDALIEDCSSSLTAEAQDFLSRVSVSASQMDQMFEGILQLSRVLRATPDLQKVHLGVALEQVVAGQSALIFARNAKVEINACNAALRTDPSLLERIGNELLKNAIFYCQKGEAPVVKIHCAHQPANKTVQISFEDNGCGVPEEARERVFFPFEKLHFGPEYKGAGMGLAIARAAAQKLGGSLHHAHLPSGTGSAFILTLPS